MDKQRQWRRASGWVDEERKILTNMTNDEALLATIKQFENRRQILIQRGIELADGSARNTCELAMIEAALDWANARLGAAASAKVLPLKGNQS
jgi:hypothetical protein